MTEYEQEIGRWKDQLILLIIAIVSTNIGIRSFKKRFPLASQKQHCIDELTNVSLSFRKYFFRSAIPLIATSITLSYFHHLSLSYNIFFKSYLLAYALHRHYRTHTQAT
jgi:TRAP-type mannitol/chloroaromatic compound transport system permease small subunit